MPLMVKNSKRRRQRRQKVRIVSIRELIQKKKTIVVLVSGAAGDIGYQLIFAIARGDMLGEDVAIELRLLEITSSMNALNGVQMEIEDCAFPLVKKVVATDNYRIAFKGIDLALLVGSVLLAPDMKRNDFLEVNAKFFQGQGEALDKYAKKGVKVLVAGDPSNANTLIVSHHAPSLPKTAFTCLTRLDQNRAKFQLAKHLRVRMSLIKKVAIWGNHSATLYPDSNHLVVINDEEEETIPDLDKKWVNYEFIPNVQRRDKKLITARKKSSAASVANAILEHIHDWLLGTPEGDWSNMGIISDGLLYNIPEGIVFSFPCICMDGAYFPVGELSINEDSTARLMTTLEELQHEKSFLFPYLPVVTTDVADVLDMVEKEPEFNFTDEEKSMISLFSIDNCILCADVGTVICMLGDNIYTDEVLQWVDKYDPEELGCITMETFRIMMSQIRRQIDVDGRPKPKDMTKLLVGTIIAVQDLEDSEKYNGLIGAIIGPYNVRDDRYLIKLNNYVSPISVRPQNLQLVEALEVSVWYERLLHQHDVCKQFTAACGLTIREIIDQALTFAEKKRLFRNVVDIIMDEDYKLVKKDTKIFLDPTDLIETIGELGQQFFLVHAPRAKVDVWIQRPAPYTNVHTLITVDWDSPIQEVFDEALKFAEKEKCFEEVLREEFHFVKKNSRLPLDLRTIIESLVSIKPEFFLVHTPKEIVYKVVSKAMQLAWTPSGDELDMTEEFKMENGVLSVKKLKKQIREGLSSPPLFYVKSTSQGRYFKISVTEMTTEIEITPVGTITSATYDHFAPSTKKRTVIQPGGDEIYVDPYDCTHWMEIDGEDEDPLHEAWRARRKEENRMLYDMMERARDNIHRKHPMY